MVHIKKIMNDESNPDYNQRLGQDRCGHTHLLHT